MKIIGGPFSEIPLKTTKHNLTKINNHKLYWVISGRAAFSCILEDIKNITSCRTIWLPAYYCSAISDILKNNDFEINYYDVNYLKGVGIVSCIEKEKVNGIILFMHYYGFIDSGFQTEISYLKNKGIIIIEDVTHSLLTYQRSYEADYYFASVRKWSGIKTGGFFSKSYGQMSNEIENTNSQLIGIFDSFFDNYKNYMHSGIGLRSVFRDCFWQCELEFQRNLTDIAIYEEDYKLLAYWDYKFVKRQRRQNATFIMSNLENKDLLIYKELVLENVPFFVPIFLKDKKERQDLCALLDEHSIFCSILWDREKENNASCNLFEHDLGLVCDERYCIDDIKKMVDIVNRFNP